MWIHVLQRQGFSREIHKAGYRSRKTRSFFFQMYKKCATSNIYFKTLPPRKHVPVTAQGAYRTEKNAHSILEDRKRKEQK